MLLSAGKLLCLPLVIAAQGKKASSPDEVAHGALLHFALYVDNVDETYQKALHFGAKTLY
ncbi:hypothetical protein MK805_09100 [Shimazuella sp. AN120528]|uniref:hypothetical protein n=1 Tax=Shimazuella soli TaxID=1892854 RepID=UPI001F0F2050|nr:hypothetical protein [Shimazuella soli]MCH5585125.1 hypothetical protein [Shimazuella soli]